MAKKTNTKKVDSEQTENLKKDKIEKTNSTAKIQSAENSEIKPKRRGRPPKKKVVEAPNLVPAHAVKVEAPTPNPSQEGIIEVLRSQAGKLVAETAKPKRRGRPAKKKPEEVPTPNPSQEGKMEVEVQHSPDPSQEASKMDEAPTPDTSLERNETVEVQLTPNPQVASNKDEFHTPIPSPERKKSVESTKPKRRGRPPKKKVEDLPNPFTSQEGNKKYEEPTPNPSHEGKKTAESMPDASQKDSDNINSSADKPILNKALMAANALYKAKEEERKAKLEQKKMSVEPKFQQQKAPVNLKISNVKPDYNHNAYLESKYAAVIYENVQNKNAFEKKSVEKTDKIKSESKVKQNKSNKKEIDNVNAKIQKVKPEPSKTPSVKAKEEKPIAESNQIKPKKTVTEKQKALKINEAEKKVKQDNKPKPESKGKNKPKVNAKAPEIVEEKPKKDGYFIYTGNLNSKNQVINEEKPKNIIIPNIKVPTINLNKIMRTSQRFDPVVEKVLKNTEHFLTNEIFVDKDVNIVVAVSGGIDSVTLLDVAVQLAYKMGFDISVAHFNHMLRGKNSNQDEAFVKELAKDYGVPHFTAQGNVKQYAEKNSLSIEQAARRLRYNFFERTTRTQNADFLLTAHTADDSAETFLINLMRGSGLTGLSGIPSKRQLVKNVVLARPFIGLTKTDLINYAEARNLRWKEDETNSLVFYTRNKIRHQLLPSLKKSFSPAIIDIINRTAKLIHGADEVITDYVTDNLDSILGQSSNEKFEIKINILKTFNDFIQGELIQAAVIKYFRFELGSMNKIDRILQLADSSTGSIFDISSAYFVLRDREFLIFARRVAEEKEVASISGEGEYKLGKTTIKVTKVNKKQIRYKDDASVEFIAADDLSDKLELRKWRQGDKFRPLGMKGTMNMSDFLANEKISHFEKQNVLVLCSNSDIIWVVGSRISDKYKITKEIKNVYKLEIIENQKK